MCICKPAVEGSNSLPTLTCTLQRCLLQSRAWGMQLGGSSTQPIPLPAERHWGPHGVPPTLLCS